MKKILLIATALAVGYIVYRKITTERDERELWAEVTDALA